MTTIGVGENGENFEARVTLRVNSHGLLKLATYRIWEESTAKISSLIHFCLNYCLNISKLSLNSNKNDLNSLAGY